MEQYNSIQQLLKKEGGQNKKPIFPPTVVQAVFDAKTGASLEVILAQFNSIYVQYQGSPEATRNIIPVEMRRAGLTITYMNMDSETITERASSAVQKDNDHWGLDVNWSRIDELSLSGDIAVSAQGTWIINGVDTRIKAVGPKGDNGLTPWLKTIDNKLHYSYDNETWEECSDYLVHYFRFNATSSDSQSGTIGKIQVSKDKKTWTDLSPEFRNYLRIQGYVATASALPANQAVGTIYGVGPTYDAADTGNTNPIYRIYVYNGTQWIDNGQFTSIAAGVVQKTGDSETEVISQAAVTRELSELGSREDLLGKISVLQKNALLKESYRNEIPEEFITDDYYLAASNGAEIQSSLGRSVCTLTSANKYGAIVIEYNHVETYKLDQANFAIYDSNSNFIGSRVVSGCGCIVVPYGYIIKFSTTNLRDCLRYCDIVYSDKDDLYQPLGIEETKVYGYENLLLDKFWALTTAGIGGTVNVTPAEISNFACFSVSCKKGDRFLLKTKGGGNALAYGFADEGRILYKTSPQNADYSNGIYINAEKDGILYVNTTETFETNFELKALGIVDRLEALETETETEIETETIQPYRILWIGNSFTDDMTAYVRELMIAANISEEYYELYFCSIGGGTLQTWVETYESADKVTAIWRGGTKTYGYTNDSMSLKDLFSTDWDVIGFNQASSIYPDYNTYNPYLAKLISYAKMDCKNANVKIGWQMAWSRWTGYNAEPMGLSGWNSIAEVTKKIMSDYNIDYLVPTGTAIQLARKDMESTLTHDLTRDGLHLSYGVGRYIAACCFFNSVISSLFKVKLYGNTAVHELTESELSSSSNNDSIDVTDANRLNLQHYAIIALCSPYII